MRGDITGVKDQTKIMFKENNIQTHYTHKVITPPYKILYFISNEYNKI